MQHIYFIKNGEFEVLKTIETKRRLGEKSKFLEGSKVDY